MNQPLRPGDPLRLGDYEVLGRLGEGGMGTVYLGEGRDGRLVAIKAVRRDFATDVAFLNRFRSEVNRAREVPPFSTAEVLGADLDHDPPYLVVEYVDGPTLAAVVRDQGPLRGAALHSVAVGIATALTAIHGARVIHRDLKPHNVLMARGGVKVIDFGIARPLDLTSAHTDTDQMVGTVAYMAPERFESDERDTVSFPADIFSWAAVVAYAATGRTPFAADSAPGTMMRILTQPPSLGGLHQPLHDIVERCLAKDPADRPTARELLDLLLASQQAPVTVASPLPEGRRLAPAGAAGLARRDEPLPAEPSNGARIPAPYDSGAASRPAAPGRLRWVVAAVAFLLVAAGGLIALQVLGQATTAPSAAPTTARSVAPPASSSGRPSGSASAPSSGPVSQSPAATGLPGILAGERRTLIHLANLDQDLSLTASGVVKVGDGTTPESLFLLVRRGSRFEIRSGLPDLSDEPRCLGVKPDPDRSARLGSVRCGNADTTLFSLQPTRGSDDKNRPTYNISSDKYGVVQWSESKHFIYVEEAGDFPAAIEFSFIDRGSP